MDDIVGSKSMSRIFACAKRSGKRAANSSPAISRAPPWSRSRNSQRPASRSSSSVAIEVRAVNRSRSRAHDRAGTGDGHPYVLGFYKAEPALEYRYLSVVRFALFNIVAYLALFSSYIECCLDGMFEGAIFLMTFGIFLVFLIGLIACGTKF